MRHKQPHLGTRCHYTLVICTCDAYEDTWSPLFTLFRKYWPGLDATIVLNTETKAYRHDGFNISCPELYRDHPNPQTIPWSKRLRDTLNQAVSTELVMLFLDDFYLRAPVDTQGLDICLRMMQGNQRLANLQLFPCPRPYTPLEEYPWIVNRSKKAPYLFSLQAGLWRKQRLLHFLRDHESPWYFERWGSRRGRRYPDDFYAVVGDNGIPAVFDYWPSMQGLSKGMWLPKTPELFAKEHIELDLYRRGVMPMGWKAPRPRRNLFKSAWNIVRSLRP